MVEVRRLIAPLLFTLIGVAILVGLGVWQIQRLGWKEAMLADIAARIAADPVALPDAPAQDTDQYRQVAVEGVLEPGVLPVLTSRQPDGPGFRVISPFRTATGRRLLVDRGFVPEALRDAVPPGGPVRLEGALFWPNETDGFTPPPDLARNTWFARDLDAMAAALGTEPLMVVARAPLTGPWPDPQPISVNIANDHLAYALTWFSLAAIWAVMGGALVRREARRARA